MARGPRREATLRGLLDVAPMAMGVVEVRGDDILVAFANATTARFLGRPGEDLQGRTARELGFSDEGILAWHGRFCESERAGGVVRFEFAHETARGPGWFAAAIGPIGSADPGAPRFSFIVEEITERRRAEQSVRDSEARLQAVLDSSKAVAYLKDLDGRYQLINRQWAELFGVTKESVVGKTDHDLFSTEIADAFRANDRRALEIGRAVESEEIAPHADGPHVYLSIKVPLNDSRGQPYATCGISTDITERKRMETALREGEERIQGLNAQLELRLGRLEVLRQIDAAIISGCDLRRTLALIADQALAHLGVDAAVVRLCDEAAGVREVAAGHRLAGEADGRAGSGPGALANRVAREGCSLHVPDLALAPLFDTRTAGLLAGGFAAYHAIPLVAKGRVVGVLELIRRGPLDPDPEWLDFAETLAGQAAIAVEYATLVDGLSIAHAELSSAYEATIEGWSRALDLRDKETEGHSRRVTEMTVRVARALGLDEAELIHIRRGALLHDIGKMGIPDSILLKPGPLTVEEWEAMRRHPDLAVEMLGPIEFLLPALAIPRCHHERWDGTGYPRGLRGEEIPLGARVFAAVDIWDALSHDRPYRRAWSPEEAREHIRSLAGSHLEPKVVEVFLEQLDAPSHHRADEGRSGGRRREAPGWIEVHDAAGSTPEGHPRQRGEAPDRPSIRRPGMKVLVAVVEDGEATAQALARCLEAMGHEVIATADGQEAWRIIQAGGARLVVADWSMPGLEGPELCRRIRAQSGRPDTYILLLTGRGGDEGRWDGLATGADDCLVRPVDARELAARLEIARRILAVQDDLLDRAVQAERMQVDLRRQNERLAELVARDPLTGLYNRRHLMEALEAQLSLSDRRGDPLSVLILDVDRFKRYNDDFGHRSGDEVLVGIAEALRANIRGHDLVARYGGEEFVILLPGCDAETACALADRFRAAIAGRAWPRRTVTASLGVATRSAPPWDGSALFDEADRALYESKRRGRDRVTHHDELANPPARARPALGVGEPL